MRLAIITFKCASNRCVRIQVLALWSILINSLISVSALNPFKVRLGLKGKLSLTNGSDIWPVSWINSSWLNSLIDLES